MSNLQIQIELKETKYLKCMGLPIEELDDYLFSEYDRIFYGNVLSDPNIWKVKDGEITVNISSLDAAYWQWFDFLFWDEFACPRYHRAARLLKMLWKGKVWHRPEEEINEKIMMADLNDDGVEGEYLEDPGINECMQEMLDRKNTLFVGHHPEIWGCNNEPTKELIDRLIEVGLVSVTEQQMRMF